MSGRAGRRGKDDKGIVIMMVDEKMDSAVAKSLVQVSAVVCFLAASFSNFVVTFVALPQRLTCCHQVWYRPVLLFASRPPNLVSTFGFIAIPVALPCIRSYFDIHILSYSEVICINSLLE